MTINHSVCDNLKYDEYIFIYSWVIIYSHNQQVHQIDNNDNYYQYFHFQKKKKN